jgi:hypothetical protein
MIGVAFPHAVITAKARANAGTPDPVAGKLAAPGEQEDTRRSYHIGERRGLNLRGYCAACLMRGCRPSVLSNRDI